MTRHVSLKAFSMVEVLVSAVVLATTVAVVFGTIMASRSPMVQADKDVRASIFAKKAMAELRSKVDTDNWYLADGALYEGSHDFITEDGFTASYVVTDDGLYGRRVDMTIRWE